MLPRIWLACSLPVVLFCFGGNLDIVLKVDSARIFASPYGYRAAKVVESSSNNEAEIRAFSLDKLGNEIAAWRVSLPNPYVVYVGDAGQLIAIYDSKSAEYAVRMVGSDGRLGVGIKMESLFSKLERSWHFRESVGLSYGWPEKIESVAFSKDNACIKMSWGRKIDISVDGIR